MYLVELKPGREELYRTGDDLAIAIRDGDVNARSRIYHRTTAKWISITLHPQYKAIIAGQEEQARPARKVWGFLPAAGGTVPVELSPGETSAVSSGSIRQRWKRPIGLGLASILLVLGIQLASSGPRPPWSDAGKRVAAAGKKTERTVRVQSARATAPAPADLEVGSDYQLDMVSLASTTSPWPLRATVAGDSIALPLEVPVVKTAPALPRAPRLRSKALRLALAPNETATMKGRSVPALLARYEAASNEAYYRLQSGIRVARLNRLFAPGRLLPGGGVPETRLGLAGAANFIRVYRQQQAGIDKAYQDSAALLTKRKSWSPADFKHWSSRAEPKEAPALQLLSSSLMAGIDSILGVLDAQAGAYKIRGTAIAFENPAATQAYGALRRSIKEQIEAAVAAGGATSFGPTGLLLQAIGTSTLPRET